MKRSSWVIIGIILVLVGTLFVLRWIARPRLSDEEQIHQVLAKAQTSVERKDVGSALSCISRDYKDPGGNNFDRLRILALRAFRTTDNYYAVLSNTWVDVRGDTADAHTDVSVGFRNGGDTAEVFSQPNMSIKLKKEKGHRWLIIPVYKWKIISISGLPEGDME